MDFRATIDMCRAGSHKSDAGSQYTIMEREAGQERLGPARTGPAINLCGAVPRRETWLSCETPRQRSIVERARPPRRRDRGSYISGDAVFFCDDRELWRTGPLSLVLPSLACSLAHPISNLAFPEGLIIRRLNWKRRS